MAAAPPFLIGVAGGTASGKTTVAERLMASVPERSVALVRQDMYYSDMTHLPIEERVKVNYDHPDAFDWGLLLKHVDALCARRAIDMPTYDFSAYNRGADTAVIGPADVVVIEGILVLWDDALRSRFDLKIFVDADPDVRFIRRLQRDMRERGRTPESVIHHYLDSVRPSYQQFVEPSKRHADVIIPHGGLNDPALDMLIARVRAVT